MHNETRNPFAAAADNRRTANWSFLIALLNGGARVNGYYASAPTREPRVSAAVVEASKAAAEKALREDALRKHSKDSKQRERNSTRDEGDGRADATGHMSRA